MSSETNKKTAQPDGGDVIRTHTDFEDGSMEKLKHGEVDPALAFANGEEVTFTPEEERKVLWKIDRAILPLLMWIYALQFADKTSLNYASLMGIREDTGLNPKSQEYSWASSIFYAGYLLWE